MKDNIRKYMDIIQNGYGHENKKKALNEMSYQSDLGQLQKVAGGVEKKFVAIHKKLKNVDASKMSDEEYYGIIKKNFDPLIKFVKSFKLEESMEEALIQATLGTVVGAIVKEKGYSVGDIVDALDWLKYF